MFGKIQIIKGLLATPNQITLKASEILKVISQILGTVNTSNPIVILFANQLGSGNQS